MFNPATGSVVTCANSELAWDVKETKKAQAFDSPANVWLRNNPGKALADARDKHRDRPAGWDEFSVRSASTAGGSTSRDVVSKGSQHYLSTSGSIPRQYQGHSIRIVVVNSPDVSHARGYDNHFPVHCHEATTPRWNRRATVSPQYGWYVSQRFCPLRIHEPLGANSCILSSAAFSSRGNPRRCQCELHLLCRQQRKSNFSYTWRPFVPCFFDPRLCLGSWHPAIQLQGQVYPIRQANLDLQDAPAARLFAARCDLLSKVPGRNMRSSGECS